MGPRYSHYTLLLHKISAHNPNMDMRKGLFLRVLPDVIEVPGCEGTPLAVG